MLGFDIGSTGSKAVLLDAETRQPLWEGYLRTDGDPVGAAQRLVERLLRSEAAAPPRARLRRHRLAGARSSARCWPPATAASAVYVLNEIAAHAAGALHVDPRVDTIFEIGGQDAKYIRLDGRARRRRRHERGLLAPAPAPSSRSRASRFQGVET